MRVAVITIALNEEQHVERWAESARDADLMMIGDTGSTDETVDLAIKQDVLVVPILVRPWRFDTARNALLAAVPEHIDLVITLDMDEVLVKGWREQLGAAPQAHRYTYDYVWNWREDGKPDVQFRGDRCHNRFGYQWKHPVHEVLYRTDTMKEIVASGGFTIHHHADDKKPRSYLPLLQQAAAESPQDDRLAHYYARELFFTGDWNAARRGFMRHLSLPTAIWAPERAQSYRYLAKMDDYPERWLLRAVAEDPSRREAWVDLAEFYLKNGQPVSAQGAAARALSITQRPGDYMTEALAWDDEYLDGIVRLIL